MFKDKYLGAIFHHSLLSQNFLLSQKRLPLRSLSWLLDLLLIFSLFKKYFLLKKLKLIKNNGMYIYTKSIQINQLGNLNQSSVAKLNSQIIFSIRKELLSQVGLTVVCCLSQKVKAHQRKLRTINWVRKYNHSTLVRDNIQ
jgi:hypothetical protein